MLAHSSFKHGFLQNVRTLRSRRGFTLIELMVALTISTILTLIAVPSFKTTFQNSRMVSQVNNLVFDFNYARSEAIKRDYNVLVCPTTTGTSCVNSTSWATGWMVYFAPPPAAGLGGITILRAEPAIAGNTTLTSTIAGNILTFQPDGSVLAAAPFKMCDARGSAYARDVEVLATGRAQASRIPGQTLNGTALTCP